MLTKHKQIGRWALILYFITSLVISVIGIKLYQDFHQALSAPILIAFDYNIWEGSTQERKSILAETIFVQIREIDSQHLATLKYSLCHQELYAVVIYNRNHDLGVRYLKTAYGWLPHPIFVSRSYLSDFRQGCP